MGKGDAKGGGINVNSPDVRVGSRAFVIPKLGDHYVGEFAAKRGRKIFRHGAGRYITHDGQTYDAYWSEDNIVPNTEVNITYKDGSAYNGTLTNYEYTGHSKYTFPDRAYIVGDFLKNFPANQITLIDPNGKKWHAPSLLAGCAIVYPENQYKTDIPKALGTYAFAREQFNNKGKNGTVATEENGHNLDE